MSIYWIIANNPLGLFTEINKLPLLKQYNRYKYYIYLLNINVPLDLAVISPASFKTTASQ